ncbi:MAG TPA: DegT/DnrJ/EryC1/StrS family aminotransferase [Lacipirellulaceae bacterium]|nr:DegT/DnrJ/EryC1/StrS family aminotransferase [Lacipirellulaceae bacterium]
MAVSWRTSQRERAYLAELVDSGFPDGSCFADFVGRLEQAFAEKFGSHFAISFTNGTATLHAALVAAGVKEGDEVIVPPLTMASTSLAALHAGAIPIFADIDPRTFNIDPASIAEHISPRTKAIIPVALYGLPPDMDAIMAIARQHDIAVIEDTAQCFLGRYKGRIAGTIGDAGSFSFQATKHMTCGEGGMLITDDPELADRIARFASLGYGLVTARPGKSKIARREIVQPSFKRHVSLGFNYRLSELCAAFALAQLERLEEFVALRQQAAAAFSEVTRQCDWLAPQWVPDDCVHSYWAYALKLDPARGITWQQFFDRFVELGGEWFYGAWALTYTEPYFQEAFGGRFPIGICPMAERIQPHLIQLKTNYGDRATIEKQSECLAKTIRYFG